MFVRNCLMSLSWLARQASLLRRPLLLAFVFGCAVSALASGRFSARLIADGAVSFAFVPAIELAAFAVVYGTGTRQRLPFARAVDLFFSGNTPWLLWLAGLAAGSCLVSPRHIGPWLLPVALSMLVPIAWSASIDFHFFREVTNRPAREAIRDLILHRTLAWTSGAAYFFGIVIWSETLPAIVRWAGL
jgi:hypothetical protein